MMTSTIPDLTFEVIIATSPVTHGQYTRRYARSEAGQTMVRPKDVQCTQNFCYSRHSDHAISIFQRYRKQLRDLYKGNTCPNGNRVRQ